MNAGDVIFASIFDNAGREETRENINIVLNTFYKSRKWEKIEDMPYNSVEDIKIVS